ncbi:hypothetical protein GCM10027040_27570 [Halomonas shantousis]
MSTSRYGVRAISQNSPTDAPEWEVYDLDTGLSMGRFATQASAAGEANRLNSLETEWEPPAPSGPSM